MTRHSPRRMLATCCATHGLHDGLSDINYVLLPLLAQAFHLSLAQVGLLRSAWRAATSLFEVPAVCFVLGGAVSLLFIAGVPLNGFGSRETYQMMESFCAIFISLPKIIQKKNIEAGNESFCR
jgi:hypothetical protein